jgi:hypothetical protein
MDFGKVTYAPGTPENAPRWVWRCGCVECRKLPPMQGLHGPFKTRRAAERDAGQFLDLYYSGGHHRPTEIFSRKNEKHICID